MENQLSLIPANEPEPVETAAVVEAPEETEVLPIPDGIHFGLSDEAYHADTALGSTGIKKLAVSPPDYWWSSPHNKMGRATKEKNHLEYGKAVHKCVLEGLDTFTAYYAPTPQPEDYKGCYVTADSIKDRLRELGAKISGNKAECSARLLEYEPESVFFDDILKQFEDEGKTAVHIDDYQRIIMAAKFISENNSLSNAFSNGMPEVSVFWTAEGVRYKARFDYLKIGAITDLKSINNVRGMDFRQACRNAIANYDYIVSAAHYIDGRKQMKRLFQNGQVYGVHDENWLEKVVNKKDFGFVFVFWQGIDAPISEGFQISPENPILHRGIEKINRGVAEYKRFLAHFGTDQVWLRDTPLEELYDHDLPHWYLSEGK